MLLKRILLASALVVGAPASEVLDAAAQQAPTAHRIGFLRNGPPPPSFVNGLVDGLRALGYEEGRNIRIEYRIASSAAQLPRAAEELAGLGVDVIVASGTVAAAKNATTTIPIVFVASIDPIATGIVASLARPGGNVTGFSGIHADLMSKRLQLLKEVLPGLSRVALLSHPANPGNAEDIRQAGSAAPALGVELQIVAARDTDEFERAFAEMRGASAAIQLDDVLFTTHRARIVELAARERLPMIFGFREFVDAGGLMAYGSDLPGQYRLAAGYVAKILKGAKPADLPVQQPADVQLVVNLKAARGLGLAIPPAVVGRANEVID
jgi:putative ABC transport system substrate-binding protein